MTFKHTAALSTATALMLSGAAFAQDNTDTATINASATVVQPISIVDTTDFDLDDSLTPEGAVFAGGAIGGEASFDVEGEPEETFSTQITDNGGANGANEITLENGEESFTLLIDAVGSTALDEVNGEASVTLAISSEQIVPEGTPTGDYTGSVDVTVTYE